MQEKTDADKQKRTMSLKRIVYWYCFTVVLAITFLSGAVSLTPLFVQLVHLAVMLAIGFQRDFTLFDRHDS